jgi:hypothetical protein
MITRYRLESYAESVEEARLDLDETEFPILQEAAFALSGWQGFVDSDYCRSLQERAEVNLLMEAVGDGEALRRLVRLMSLIPAGDVPKRVVTEEHFNTLDDGFVEGRRVVKLVSDDEPRRVPEPFDKPACTKDASTDCVHEVLLEGPDHLGSYKYNWRCDMDRAAQADMCQEYFEDSQDLTSQEARVLAVDLGRIMAEHDAR